MAKKRKPQPAQADKQTQQPVAETPITNFKSQTPDSKPQIAAAKPWTFYDFKVQAIIVAVLAFVLYFNSFNNEFAHDDGIVIVKNEYVQEGFAGIHNIMTKDAYDSYYRQLNTTNQLSGGRFRPLSIVTFAIEQEFMGAVPTDKVDSVLKQNISYGVSGPEQQKLIEIMHVRHVVNVLIYMLSVVVLLYFLRFIVFSNNPMMAFVAALLFTAHPIHTEVIANVKSRDEIMSLLFMCLTFIFAFKYEDNKRKIWHLFLALASFLLAFLSKEYAITIVALLPLALFIFRGYSIPKSITAVLPYLVIVAFYLALRINVLAPSEDADSGANPFVISAFPKLATIAAIIALYFYVRIPRKLQTDSKTLTRNILIFLPYFFFAAIYLYQRFLEVPPVTESAAKEVLNNPYLFATHTQKIATEIATSLNYIKLLLFPYPLSADYSFNTIPYVDFSNLKVWLSIAVHGGMIALMGLYFYHIYMRNIAADKRAQMKIMDVSPAGTNTQSMEGILLFAIAFYFIHLLLVCNIVFDIGATMGERLIYHSSVGFVIAVSYFLCKGMGMIKNKVVANGGLAAIMSVIIILFGIQTVARNAAWKNDATLFSTDLKTVPNSVLVNANVAASYITIADYQKTDSARRKYLMDAVKILDHTLSIHRTFVAGFLNRGIAWYKLGDIDKSKPNIDTVRSLYPNYPTLPGMYKLISDYYLKNGWDSYGKNGRYAEAVAEYKKGLAIDSTNVDLWYNMGGAYFTNKQYNEAAGCFQRALKLKPDNAQAQNGLAAAVQMLNGGAQAAKTKK